MTTDDAKNISPSDSSRNDSPPNAAKQWAVLVGIDTYQDESITPLRYCVADIRAFHETLIHPEIGGFPPENVYLMTDGEMERDRPTNANVLFQLENMAERVQPEDTFVFYFSGHGMIREGNPFLLSVNADGRSLTILASTAIRLDEVRRICDTIPANQKLLILDACRNDPDVGKGDADNLLTEAFARNIRIPSQVTSGGMPSVTATLYACSVGERAYEWNERQHGVFSYYLLEGLRGEATTPDGDVTVATLTNYTQQQVVDWTREHLSGGKTQTPWLVLEGATEFVLTGEPYRISILLRRARERWEAEDHEGAMELWKRVLEIDSANPEAEAGMTAAQRAKEAVVEEVISFATLTVSSKPPDAAIYVDTAERGKTPATISVDMGVSGEKTVDMALTREGYLTKRGRVLLQAGGTTNWDATLEPDPTYVTEAERLRQEQARRATERQQAEQQRQAEAERPQRIRTETVSNQAKRPQRNLKPWLVLAAVGMIVAIVVGFSIMPGLLTQREQQTKPAADTQVTPFSALQQAEEENPPLPQADIPAVIRQQRVEKPKVGIESQKNKADSEVMAFVEEWKQAIESEDPEKYIALLSSTEPPENIVADYWRVWGEEKLKVDLTGIFPSKASTGKNRYRIEHVPVTLYQDGEVLVRLYRNLTVEKKSWLPKRWELINDKIHIPPSSIADTASIDAKNKLSQVLDKWLKAWRNKDLETYMSIYAEKARIVVDTVRGGKIYRVILTKAELREKMRFFNKRESEEIDGLISDIKIVDAHTAMASGPVQEFKGAPTSGSQPAYSDHLTKRLILKVDPTDGLWMIYKARWRIYIEVPKYSKL